MNSIIILISSILLIIDIIIYQKNRKILKRKIKNHNKIRFTKLSKQFLSNTNEEDIKDLISFLYQYLEKEKKNENKE